MSTSAEPLNLFPAASQADWRGLVDKVLKGAPFEKLVGKTYDGLPISPLYPRALDAAQRALRATPGAWDICTRIDHTDVGQANTQALEDLENGASGLSFVFAAAPDAHGFGIKDTSATGIARLMSGIHFETGIAVSISAGDQAGLVAGHVFNALHDGAIDPASVRINFGLDPIGAMASSGMIITQWAQSLASSATDLVAKGFSHPLIVADTRVVHAAGGSEAQELAFTLGAGIAYLRAMEAAGLSLDRARALISFRLASDADEFLNIAKFRALRRLWARIEDACGLAPHPLRLEAETAWRMLTRRDPWVNLLRGTMATFSAALGGADAITVLPYTQALGLPDPFARRIARNTQLVLMEEANLHKVADPAAGAGGFEALTHDLCEKAWALFQVQESAGGLVAALQTGTMQAEIAKVRAERQRNIARRRDPLTGISEFANLKEAPVSVLEPLDAAKADGAAPSATMDFTPLVPMRLASSFEALRDRAETKSPAPKVFLANLGPISAFAARASFARNLYEAGGIAAPGNDGFESTADVVSAFNASGASIACICGSDATYAERAADVAMALRAAGAAQVSLAGRPGDLEEALKKAGVSAFFFAGGDALAMLEDAHRHL